MEVLSTFLQVVGSLGLFLFGMKLMSDGLQNCAGERMRKLLSYMTVNRFTALFSGLAITSVIQSSSATTVFVVSFVNAGMLSLQQAIGVILGANIGTTVTAWIVSVFGFRFDIAKMAIPAIAIGLPFIFMKARSRRDIGETFIGFGLLFLGLFYLKAAVPDIGAHPEALRFISEYAGMGFLSNLLFVLIGTVVTVIIQSSSAAMAVTLTMAYSGWIDFSSAASLCLGENIGTTITAQLAAIGQRRNCRRAAMAHTMFNVVGVIWVLAVFRYFLMLIDFLVPGDFNNRIDMLNHLSMFHTVFNTLNCVLFVGFVPQFARMIEKIVTGADESGRGYRLNFISASLQDTPEMNYVTACAETEKMSREVRAVFSAVKSAYGEKFLKRDFASQLEAREKYIDEMQEEITSYISKCMQDSPGGLTSANMGHLLRIVDELESMGDCCYNIGIITRKRMESGVVFSEDIVSGVNNFFEEAGAFCDFICAKTPRHVSAVQLSQAMDYEKNMNRLRNELKLASRGRIQGGADVKAEIFCIDTLEQLEHFGDCACNIAQELSLMAN